MEQLRRLLAQAWPYRGRFLLACVAMVGFAATSAGLAYLVKPVFDDVLIRNINLGRIAALIAILYLGKGLFSYFATYLMSWVGQRTVMDLRNRLYQHVIRQSVGFFKRQSTGTLMSHITNDVERIQLAVSEAFGDLLMQSFALVGYGALLFYYDWRLAIIALVSAPLAVYPLVTLGRKLRRTTDTGLERWRDITNILQETISGSRIVKAFRMEAFETGRFVKATERLFRTNMRITRVVSIMPPIMELVGGLGLAAAIWYGSGRIAAGTMTTGEFTSFMAALFAMYMPVKKLSRVNATFQQALSAAARIFAVLDTEQEIREAPDAIELAPLANRIEFRDVGFIYGDGEGATLTDINFMVEVGQVVALVGTSGAGKSTLASLVPRFYDPTGGAVLFDGIDIRRATLSSLRGQIGLVTQETILFNDTIRNNIAYGLSSIDDEAIRNAAKAANALEFIEATPHGFDTVVGERGQRLSGGERQRLAIARAILKNPPILVLDEATSSLDAESEALVQQALENLMADRTTLVIAHRLSTVRRADLIVVIDEGRIHEIGRHKELVRRPDGLYRRLYQLQFALGPDPVSVGDEP
ncbi:MAG TPA: ABC transporter transmembrane domain-containing protein [Vicinamibacteria bacterium]|nr:ABC transporter transmembrane domain-containing protein [Vicinamibacteria bacterium]